MRHSFWARSGATAAALAGLIINFTGCSSDEGEGGDTQSTGADPLAPPPRSAKGSIFDDLGVDDPEHDEFIFKNVKKPYEDEAGCKAFDSRFPDEHDCACEKCFAVQQQCDALPGCIEIAECGIEIGCTDANSCYLLAPAGKQQCVPIIDRWGNTGTASALSLTLSTCTADNKCR
jgi:hypothetical protein